MRLEQLLEGGAARGQRLVAKIELADPKEIEHIQRRGLFGGRELRLPELKARHVHVDAMLELLKAERSAVPTERDDFAVNDDGVAKPTPPRDERLDDVGELRGLLVAV